LSDGIDHYYGMLQLFHFADETAAEPLGFIDLSTTAVEASGNTFVLR
jgi:hypothetical protein